MPHCVRQVVVDSSLRFIVGYLIQARKVALFAFIINVACLGNAPRGYCESIGNTAEPVGAEVGGYPGQPQPGQIWS